MSFRELERALQSQVSESVYVVTDEDGKHYIPTPFVYGDGDGPTIALRRHGSGWALSDEGSTMMRLSWRLSEEELEEPVRKRKISDALALSQARQENGELLLTVNDSRYGEALFDFIHSLLLVDELGYPERSPMSSEQRITDIDFFDEQRMSSYVVAEMSEVQTHKERPVSIADFKREFTDIVRESLPDNRLNFDWYDPDWDPGGNYVVDCMINGTDSPLFLYAPGNHVQARDTTITIYRFNDQEIKGRHAAIFRDSSKLPKKVKSQLRDVCDVTFDNFERERESIRKFLNTLRQED